MSPLGIATGSLDFATRDDSARFLAEIGRPSMSAKDHTFTLGIEEEFAIIDPETRELRSHIHEILEGGKITLKEQIKPEMHQSVVELGTEICQSIVDARKRLLKPHGVLIPKCDTLWAGVVNAAAVHAKIVPASDRALGLDMRLAWNISSNKSTNKRFTETQLVTAPQPLAVLDYSEIEDPDLDTQVKWDVTRSGDGHGIILWFDRTLADGVCFSTAPGEPEMIYGGLFLPWPQPVELNEEDAVLLNIRADLRGEEYIWSWNTRISRAAQVKHTFRQSSFFGEPHSPARLRKQSTTHVPRLNEDGEINRFILQLMNGENAIEDIAREVVQQFPARFPTLDGAIAHTAKLSRDYSI